MASIHSMAVWFCPIRTRLSGADKVGLWIELPSLPCRDVHHKLDDHGHDQSERIQSVNGAWHSRGLLSVRRYRNLLLA